MNNFLIPNYGRLPLTLTRGQGSTVWDDNGKEYLDFGGGIAVNSLGHAHPAMVRALAEQGAQLIHCSNLYSNEAQQALAQCIVEKIVRAPGKCLFCNSGAEANEALIKLARKFGHHSPSPDGTPRTEILTFERSFHGRTMGALSATGQAKMQQEFGPMLPGFRHLPLNDMAALEKAVSRQTVAILLEPIQGEGGIHLATSEFLHFAKALAEKRNLLLLFDEVQCGIARAGTLNGWEALVENVAPIWPDAISWAKGMGGGFPIGAIWVSQNRIVNDSPLCDLFGPGSHGTTFGGSPLASKVALAVLDTILSENLADNAREQGSKILQQISSWQSPFIAATRGKGLMIGIELAPKIEAIVPDIAASGVIPSVWVVKQLLESGLITIPSGTHVVRLLPALNVTTEETALALERLHFFFETLATRGNIA